MDAYECIMTRRSIRSYSEKMPDDETLEKVLAAGTYAPSAKNLQTSIIILVKNRELRDRLSKLNAKVLGTENDPFYGAPVVAVVLSARGESNHVVDGALVMGNLMNAAHALGLGSCWINRAREVFDTEEGKAILSELGIEGDWEGIGNCILGYAKGDAPQARARKQDYVKVVE